MSPNQYPVAHPKDSITRQARVSLVCLAALQISLGVLTLACKEPADFYPPAKALRSMTEVEIGTPTMEPVLASLGQYVGEGNQVVTTLDFEALNRGEYSLDNLWVRGQRAVVEALDPRTGSALLSVLEASPSTAAVGDASKLVAGETVTIVRVFGASGTIDTVQSTVTRTVDSSPLQFEVGIQNHAGQSNLWSRAVGATVIDKKGRMLGLVGARYDQLTSGNSSTELSLHIVTIDSMLRLLSPGIDKQPWANGPAITALVNRGGLYGYTSGILTTTGDYEKMTAAVHDLAQNLGRRLDESQLPVRYPDFVRGFPQTGDGNLLTLVYSRPVELKSLESGVAVRANWIALQWGRSAREAAVVFYGFTPYLVAGGFAVSGDISSLLASLDSLPLKAS